MLPHAACLPHHLPCTQALDPRTKHCLLRRKAAAAVDTIINPSNHRNYAFKKGNLGIV